jgi:hypothetical protein
LTTQDLIGTLPGRLHVTVSKFKTPGQTISLGLSQAPTETVTYDTHSGCPSQTQTTEYFRGAFGLDYGSGRPLDYSSNSITYPGTGQFTPGPPPIVSQLTYHGNEPNTHTTIDEKVELLNE